MRDEKPNQAKNKQTKIFHCSSRFTSSGNPRTKRIHSRCGAPGEIDERSPVTQSRRSSTNQYAIEQEGRDWLQSTPMSLNNHIYCLILNCLPGPKYITHNICIPRSTTAPLPQFWKCNIKFVLDTPYTKTRFSC